ncbi:uncharacterized protein LOC121974925 isoform X2 [Zingiber officinale]|uniref:uncharacterized protein LOC121974925 isoform X2 n=1 Tax=Zingiber officinale TaxID=94328 RepID=UPI001C4B53C8|nr:uncharacterized protein LOC121974925 isoform X2 [Zingiber officinale]
MDRFRRRLQVEVPQDNGGSRDGSGGAVEKPMEAQNEGMQGDELEIADEEPGQFAGLKLRRRAALAGNCKGDYVGVSYDPFLDKILRKQGKMAKSRSKKKKRLWTLREIVEPFYDRKDVAKLAAQEAVLAAPKLAVITPAYIDEELAAVTSAAMGDRTVLFADKVIKVTGSGKMKKQIMLITDFAIYLVDSDADALKRRIALAAVEKICSSKFSDNFFALIIPTEYDCLMASTRKTEIVNVLIEATKGATEELEVVFSNRSHWNKDLKEGYPMMRSCFGFY